VEVKGIANMQKIRSQVRSPRLRAPRRAAGFALLAGVALVVAGCSSPSASSTPTSTATHTAIVKGSGNVSVLYAGSLVTLMENQVGPAFHDATGYTLQGYGEGSSALAAEIKGKVRQGDVFVSASPAVNQTLQGAANGNWVSWYATFANSPLVIGYNPQSSFAKQLKSEPWYKVVGQAGFKLGSTDPATDPKGALAAQALKAAATQENEPALATLATSNPNIQTEQSLVGQLQSGQLDAGFFYTSEAKAANIPTVPLTGQSLKAVYTITELNGAPDPAGAQAFISFLLGSQGQSILKKDAFELTSPAELTGTGVPHSLKDLFGKK
jgi:molybdate/tungstate transport system substrate-binding protein